MDDHAVGGHGGVARRPVAGQSIGGGGVLDQQQPAQQLPGQRRGGSVEGHLVERPADDARLAVGVGAVAGRRGVGGQQDEAGVTIVGAAGGAAGIVHGSPQAIAVGHQPGGQPLAQGRGHGRLVRRGDAQQPGQLPDDALRGQGEGALPLPVELGDALLLPGQFVAAAVEVALGVAGGAAQLLQAVDVGRAGAALGLAGRLPFGQGGAGFGRGRLQPGQRRGVGGLVRRGLGRGGGLLGQPLAQLIQLRFGLGQRRLRLPRLSLQAADGALAARLLGPLPFEGGAELGQVGLVGL